MVMVFYPFVLTLKLEDEHVESVLLLCYKSKVLHVVYDERTTATKTHTEETAIHTVHLWFVFCKGYFIWSIVNAACTKHIAPAVNMFWIVKKEKRNIGVISFLAAWIFFQPKMQYFQYPYFQVKFFCNLIDCVTNCKNWHDICIQLLTTFQSKLTQRCCSLACW